MATAPRFFSRIQARPSIEVSAENVGALTDTVPELFSGAPGLEGPTKHKGDLHAFTAQDRSGRYLHYGIREQAMALMMNGIAAHRGLVPVGAIDPSFPTTSAVAAHCGADEPAVHHRLQSRFDRRRPQRPYISAGGVPRRTAGGPQYTGASPSRRSETAECWRWLSPTGAARSP